MELRKARVNGYCKPARGAAGTELSNGFRKISIIFDQALFDAIGRQAAENGRAFAEQVREYVSQAMALK